MFAQCESVYLTAHNADVRTRHLCSWSLVTDMPCTQGSKLPCCRDPPMCGGYFSRDVRWTRHLAPADRQRVENPLCFADRADQLDLLRTSQLRAGMMDRLVTYRHLRATPPAPVAASSSTAMGRQGCSRGCWSQKCFQGCPNSSSDSVQQR